MPMAGRKTAEERERTSWRWRSTACARVRSAPPARAMSAPSSELRLRALAISGKGNQKGGRSAPCVAERCLHPLFTRASHPRWQNTTPTPHPCTAYRPKSNARKDSFRCSLHEEYGLSHLERACTGKPKRFLTGVSCIRAHSPAHASSGPHVGSLSARYSIAVFTAQW
eukprot:1948956-Rhodomonas_salina.4